MSITVKVLNLNEVLRDLNLKMSEVKDDVKKEVAIASNDVRNGALDRVAVDTGALRASIRIEYYDKKMSSEIGSDLKYAQYIEKGRRHGYVPWLVIEQWVKRKGIAGLFSIKTRKGSKSKKSDSLIKTAIFFIRRKIMREGFKAQPFLGPAYDRAIPKFLTRLAMLKYKK